MAELDIKLEDVLETDYKILTSLLGKWLPKAEEDESAVSAVVKLINQRGIVARGYIDIRPEEESPADSFVRQRKERQAKTTSKFKK